MTYRSLVAFGIFAACSADAAETVNTTDLVAGIATDVPDIMPEMPGGPFPVRTYPTAVRYQRPKRVQRPSDNLSYWEVTGTIEGIGWGGILEIPTHPELGQADKMQNFTYYKYGVSFALRWTDQWEGTLDTFSHGGVGSTIEAVYAAHLKTKNDFNPMYEGDALVSDVVLRSNRSHAYFTINAERTADGQQAAYVMRPDGSVDTSHYVDLYQDVPLGRDTVQVAKRLLAKLTGRPVQRTIGVGHSAGGFRLLHTHTGRYGIAHLGDIHEQAYNKESPRIYDGFLLLGIGCWDAETCNVDPVTPLEAPMIFAGGEADQLTAMSLAQVSAILQNGGPDAANLVTRLVRIYQVAGVSHNFDEMWFPMPNALAWSEEVQFGGLSMTHSGHMAPVTAVLIDNVVRFLRDQTPLPAGRIDGELVTGPTGAAMVRYLQPHRKPGSAPSSDYAYAFPFADDPSSGDDTNVPSIIPPTLTPDVQAQAFIDVTAVVPYVSGAIELPEIACRLGAFRHNGFWTALDPFTDPKAFWGDVGAYKACVQNTISRWAAAGLYDPTFAPTQLDPF